MERVLWVRLGQRVQFYREQRGWSQSELAYRAGVSRSTVSDIERAVHVPETFTFIRLTEALSVTYADLFQPPTDHLYPGPLERSRTEGEGHAY